MMNSLADSRRPEEGGVFDRFAREFEPRLRQALTAALGPELGLDATEEALVFGWENWSRISRMDNPHGYIYRMGKRWGTKSRTKGQRQWVFRESPTFREIEFEPGLAAALSELSERQRAVIGLLYGYQWTMSEVADLLDVSKATVQSYRDRAMTKLRKALGVADDD